MKKLSIFTLALGLTLGFTINSAMAIPDARACLQLKQRCLVDGDQGACATFLDWCSPDEDIPFSK